MMIRNGGNIVSNVCLLYYVLNLFVLCIISTEANTTSPASQPGIPVCNATVPKPCAPYGNLAFQNGTLLVSPIINSSRQMLNVTCEPSYTLTGSNTLECIDGSWFPTIPSLRCIGPCPTWQPLANMNLRPPMPPEPVHHMSSFRTECSLDPIQRPPPPPMGVVNPFVGEGLILCYETKWYYHEVFGCEEERVTKATTELGDATTVTDAEPSCATSVPDNTTAVVSSSEDTTTFPASIVYALSALVAILLFILLMMLVCLCRSRRNNDCTKRMQKSGFKDQLSIFQKAKPIQLTGRPPKLPERPSTVGSVGSIRYQEHGPPKLPGQKIAEEEEEARKIEAIREEIYEQIGKRGDQPEYIDVFQTK